MPLLYDPTYILVLIAFLISTVADIYCRSTFNKYNGTFNEKGFTSNAVAKMILNRHGINNVTVGSTSGELSDHYNPSTGELKFSDSVYGNESVAAIAVAAHECGHVLQHDSGYFPIKIRAVLAPVSRIGTIISLPIIILGIILELAELAYFGVYLFSAILAVELLTLPIEFNASRRALAELKDGDFLNGDELVIAQKVLISAALTYVASTTTTILHILRFLLLIRGSGRRK